MVDPAHPPPLSRKEKLQLKRMQNVAKGLMMFKRGVIFTFIGMFTYKLYHYTRTPDYQSFKARRKFRIQSETKDPDVERLYELEKKEIEMKENNTGKIEAEIF